MISLNPAIVAIDGPAASGKSTIGYQLAQTLGFLFFDTGVMYRAVTWVALDRRIDMADGDALGRLAQAIRLDIRPPGQTDQDGRQCTVLADGEDITWKIRLGEVDRNVSLVSAVGEVRRALSLQQRRIGLHYGSGEAELTGIVMVGRDIGTVVLPAAGLKIYLDASPEERARRRFTELQQRGKDADLEQIYRDIIRRDRQDSERALSPLRAAADATVVDTTSLTPEQVVETLLDLVYD